MIPWEEIDRATVPGRKNELILRRRGEEFSIRTGGTELMNSRMHGSEEALANLAFEHMGQGSGLRILVGGLGMGYTLARTLAMAPSDARILVAELIPEVIAWNRSVFGHMAGMPLNDPRVRVDASDVGAVIHRQTDAFDAILLDVDNGPTGLTQDANNRLYAENGLKAAFRALTPGGVLGIWSAGDDPVFTRRLANCGFKARAVSVSAVAPGRGGRHVVWIAVKPEGEPG
ncbi:MAG: hypothetical protein KBG98_08265 [Desulfobacter sp.]|uniref:spermidine synthase n=1 Tax=Desulfobacter sp. TaxID=2294 RepID=UPI001B76892D|nr:hypothetical protein [Desulfobacter sp.]MBP8829632.1 hypothetical protein [Desulfobacter sp.]